MVCSTHNTAHSGGIIKLEGVRETPYHVFATPSQPAIRIRKLTGGELEGVGVGTGGEVYKVAYRAFMQGLLSESFAASCVGARFEYRCLTLSLGEIKFGSRYLFGGCW